MGNEGLFVYKHGDLFERASNRGDVTNAARELPNRVIHPALTHEGVQCRDRARANPVRAISAEGGVVGFPH